MPPRRTEQITSGTRCFQSSSCPSSQPNRCEPGRTLQRSVFGTTVVEMDAHPPACVFQNLRRRLDLPHASLVRPANIAGDVDSRGDGDHAVLVPEQRPVRAGNLVKVDGADRERTFTENRINKVT